MDGTCRIKLMETNFNLFPLERSDSAFPFVNHRFLQLLQVLRRAFRAWRRDNCAQTMWWIPDVLDFVGWPVSLLVDWWMLWLLLLGFLVWIQFTQMLTRGMKCWVKSLDFAMNPRMVQWIPGWLRSVETLIFWLLNTTNTRSFFLRLIFVFLGEYGIHTVDGSEIRLTTWDV